MDPLEHPDFRDFDNPYAPPQSEFVPEPVAPIRAGMPFGANDVFTWSWSIFKERMGICLGIFWGTYGINFSMSLGVNVLVKALLVAARDTGMLAVVGIVVAYVVSIVINSWLWVGQTQAYLKIARNEPVTFAEVFQGGRYLLTMIGASIIFVIAVTVPVMVGIGVSAAGLGLIGNQSIGGTLFFVIGTVITTVLGLYLLARLMMYFYMIVDCDAGAIDSLQQSWELTRNKAATMILVFIFSCAVYIAGILAFCVGIIFSLPLAVLMLAVTYSALVGTGPRPSRKSELIWEDEL